MEALKCEVCGGELALDAAKDLYLCEHCGTRFPAKKAPAISPDAPAFLQMADALSLEKLIQNGRTMLELGDYARARGIFHKATENYPEDYRGWWHLFLCDTRSMTEIRPDKGMFYKTKNLEYAFKTAPKEAQPDLLKQYRAFAGQCMKKGCDLEIAKLVSECRQIDADILAHEAVLADCRKELQSIKRKKRTAIILFCIVTVLMLVSFVFLSPWMLLTIPLFIIGTLGLRGNVGTRKSGPLCQKVAMHTQERDRLEELKKVKQEYLQKLQDYVRALPMMMEKLTIADVLNQKKYIA